MLNNISAFTDSPVNFSISPRRGVESPQIKPIDVKSSSPKHGDAGCGAGLGVSGLNSNNPDLLEAKPPLGILQNLRPGSKDALSIPGLSGSIDFETGELLPSDSKLTAQEKRLQRFCRQSVVRRLMPKSRTAKCLRYIAPGNSDVKVMYSRVNSSAHYKNLQVCSSVWSCPVCAAKISERRRIEVLNAIERHNNAGGRVLLLTPTFPHSCFDGLRSLLDSQASAFSHFTSLRAVKSLLKSIGYVGMIRAWEVTRGDKNGWHPHYHVLLFVSSDFTQSLDCLKASLYAQWVKSCLKSGLDAPSYLHGIDLRDGDSASAYVSKWGLDGSSSSSSGWGLDAEITKGHIKDSKKGRSPFQLLDSYMSGDKQAGALFIEYSNAFKGRRQLYWSKGLKELFGIKQASDEDIAADNVDDSVLFLGSISFEQWRAIVKLDLRGELLELARSGSWDPVQRLLDSLTSLISSGDTS